MIRTLRALARAFSTYRSWHAAVVRRMPSDTPRDGGRGRSPDGTPAQAPMRRPAPEPVPVRRVRCLSEPCSNARLALALLRAHRTLDASADAGSAR